MDATEVERIWEFLRKETERRLGPRSPGYQEFLSGVTRVDPSPYLGRGTHLVDHYRYLGSSMTAYNIPGIFEGNKMELRPEDILLTSYPKTGTTWLSEIVYLLLHDADVRQAESAPIDHRVPYLEWPHGTLEELRRRPSPRFIKTHRPYHWLPDGGCQKKYKIVYIARNPKDTVVSFYHFCKQYKLVQFVGDFSTFLDLFLNDVIAFAPFDKHVLGYWERRQDPNVHFVLYEDLHKDTVGEVKRLARFLGKEPSDEQLRSVVEATTFQKMEGNATANHGQWEKGGIIGEQGMKFMRKGKIGDWKNHLDEDANRRFDAWIRERFGHSDLRFEYE